LIANGTEQFGYLGRGGTRSFSRPTATSAAVWERVVAVDVVAGVT
jgi:hypothetical protein